MHAYMIIAHNQFELLEKLIKALDDERNAVFVHIDAKVKDFDFEHFKALPERSRLVFTEKRIDVTWGDSSQVETEMLLIKTAVENEDINNPFDYYHLISGVDFPIKSPDYIHSFFKENDGKEFVHFTDIHDSTVAENRLRYYHLFRGKRNTLTKSLSQLFLRFQKLLKVNRLKNAGITPQKGCNWFSVTGGFMHYVYDRLGEYERLFKNTYCADEVFIQTALINGPFKEKLFMPECEDNHFACLRLIDWKRGNPYVWTAADFDEIKASECLFARK